MAKNKVVEFLETILLLYFMRQNGFVNNCILNQVSKIQMKGVANQINPQSVYTIEKRPITTRQGDWVCLNCSNWNFSFRKYCNRCKYQSRQNNHISSFYIYYYTNNCQLQQKNQAYETHTNYSEFIVTPPKKIDKLGSKQKSDKKLPSVSPLIKKYKASKAKNLNSTTFEQNSQIYSIVQDYAWSMQKDFTTKQDTRDEIQLYDSSDEYLENIISKIMI